MVNPHQVAAERRLQLAGATSNEQQAPITIIADLRERASGIPRALSEKGLEVRMQRLEAGDYLLTPKIAVERKTTADFVQSIFDKRLFAQVGVLRMSFPCPILLLEECSSPSREIHPHAVRGAMLYVSLLNRIPIIHTENAADTVEMLFAMAQLVHRETAQEFSLHAKRRSPSPQKTQRYLLETIPGIGPHLAKALLQQFGNLQAVFNAAPDDLMEVPGIGRNRAEKIRALLQRDYRSGQQLISKISHDDEPQFEGCSQTRGNRE